MVACGIMRRKASTCLYIDRKVMEIAKNLGVNVSRVSENALIAAIGRLQNPETRNESNGSAEPLVRGVGFGPTNPSGMGSLITEN
jgi:post-segregation antitoxin (ccd killing protein)